MISEDLRLYIEEKETLCHILVTAERCVESNNTDQLADLGQTHLSNVLIVLASPHTSSLPDDIPSDAWSICDLLTVSEPVNSQIFINSGGLLIAFTSLKEYEGNVDIERTILRVLLRMTASNSASFIRTAYIQRLLNLLRSCTQVVSFLSCKLLAKLLHEGPLEWCITTPKKNDVILEMENTMDHQWNLGADMGISTSSLEKDEQTKYLKAVQQPILQYFGSWELCYYLCTDPERYWKLVISDLGLHTLDQVIDSSQTEDKVKTLLNHVVKTTQRMGKH